MSRLAPLLALALGACLELEGAEVVVDVREQRVTLTLVGLASSDPEGELASLRAGSRAAGLLDDWPRLEVLRDTFVPVDARLDLRIDARLARPSDFGLRAWDARHPYRWCPPRSFVITAANAVARDADGCVLWGVGAEVLRVSLVHRDPPTGKSLREAYRPE